MFRVIRPFGDIIIRAGLERSHRRAFVPTSRQYHHGKIQPAFPHLSDKIHPGAIRQIEVAQQEIETISVRERRPRCLQRWDDFHDPIGIVAQETPAGEIGIDRIVFNVKYPHHIVRL